MPATAPSRPASQVPDVLFTLPERSSSAVCSPRYQTLPWASWLYQSVVRSSSVPLRYSRSWTTAHATPSIVRVARETTTTSRIGSPSFVPTYTARDPGTRGNHRLVTCALKLDAGGIGGSGSCAGAAAVGASSARAEAPRIGMRLIVLHLS